MTNYVGLAKDARDCRERQSGRAGSTTGSDAMWAEFICARGSFGPERSSGAWEPNRLCTSNPAQQCVSDLPVMRLSCCQPEPVREARTSTTTWILVMSPPRDRPRQCDCTGGSAAPRPSGLSSAHSNATPSACVDAMPTSLARSRLSRLNVKISRPSRL
jgi:hypothetical protein